jgi:hypothetical protein
VHDLRPQMLGSLGDDLAKLSLIDVAGWNHETIIARPVASRELLATSENRSQLPTDRRIRWVAN